MCSTPLLNIGKPRVFRKTKGIDAKPIPNNWINWMATKIEDDDSSEVIKQKLFTHF